MSSKDFDVNSCIFCDSTSIETAFEKQQFAFRHGSQDVLLTVEVPVTHCNDCGESIIGSEAEAIQHEAVCDFLGRLSPREIKEMRKQKKVSQQSLADATGIGVASIKRWETGALIQSEAMDKLLREFADGSATRHEPKFRPVFRTELKDYMLEDAKQFRLRCDMNGV